MYYNIHSMFNEGYSRRQIAARLQLDFRTVSKYLSLSPEEFDEQILKRERQSDLELYATTVLDWLKRDPDLSSAQVLDRLKEHYEVTSAGRTVRRFVSALRKKHNIPKVRTENIRQYSAIPDPPMGRQVQVDIGITWVSETTNRKSIKLYCVAMVFSHSRYKWGRWYDRPLRTSDFVEALEIGFEFFGGMPKEIVVDQDRLLAVDENFGEVIFTREFEQFRLSSGLEVYLCRKNDPETKGRAEAVVKYFKRSFARKRSFDGIEAWNESFEDWLYRTGNAKEHGTTKKIPAEVFAQERLLLKPVPSTNRVHTNSVTRIVHKNNTIFYQGNRYSLPLGTYMPGMMVSLVLAEERLIIKDEFGDRILAEHQLSTGKGELVSNNHHLRDMSQKLDELQQVLWERFNGSEDAWIFLSRIRNLRPRYYRDQCAMLLKTTDVYDLDTIDKALSYCMTHSLFSAVEFSNAASYFAGSQKQMMAAIESNPKVVFLPTAAAVSRKRDLAVYERVVKGGEQR